MDIKNIKNNNKIVVRKLSDGTEIYIVNLGTIIYNNRLVNLNNLVIPLYNQSFFVLPEDQNKYAVVNIYYDIDKADFIYDVVGKYNKRTEKVSATALYNYVPIAQFVLKQDHSSFEVDHYNEYTQMATFAISDDLVKGEVGEQGNIGVTGYLGDTGPQGNTGSIGPSGITGLQSPTGLGEQGPTGLRGITGYYPDPNLLLYLKFKSDDIVQTDYSIYERDVTWGISGGNSYVIRKEGVVDNCHAIYHDRCYSAYKRNIYLPFGESGGSISAWIKLEASPTASFTYEEVSTSPIIYRFTDTSLMFPNSWLWDFGDGTNGTGSVVYHKYTAGTYTVTLTVKNYTGEDTATSTVVISFEE